MTREADSCSHTSGSPTDTAPTGSSGKTSREFCRRTADGRLEPSSGRWMTSGMGSHTGFWTLNSCEHADTLGRSPSEGDVSSLSRILETGVLPQRYYLTPKACEGVLRRAEKHNKRLPEPLEAEMWRRVGEALI